MTSALDDGKQCLDRVLKFIIGFGNPPESWWWHNTVCASIVPFLLSLLTILQGLLCSEGDGQQWLVANDMYLFQTRWLRACVYLLPLSQGSWMPITEWLWSPDGGRLVLWVTRWRRSPANAHSVFIKKHAPVVLSHTESRLYALPPHGADHLTNTQPLPIPYTIFFSHAPFSIPLSSHSPSTPPYNPTSSTTTSLLKDKNLIQFFFEFQMYTSNCCLVGPIWVSIRKLMSTYSMLSW